MAKRQERAQIDNPFTKTEPGTSSSAGQGEIPAEGHTRPVAVGLRESEIELLDQVAADHGVARNAVMRWALRWFLKEYAAGRAPLAAAVKTPKPKNIIDMP